MTKISTGNKIKEQRSNLNLTQKQLADMVGVSNKAISKWENDEGLPDIENLKRLSSVFNMSIDDLVSNKPIEQPKSMWSYVLIMSPILTIATCFLPFVKINPFAEVGNEFYISVSGFRMLVEIFTNMQIGNIILSISLFVILLTTFFQLYRYFNQKDNLNLKVLSIGSIISAIAILVILLILSRNKTLLLNMTFTPIFLLLLQVIQFIAYIKEV